MASGDALQRLLERAAMPPSWRAAVESSYALLVACLSRQQRRELHKHDYFHVTGSEGGLYRIHTDGTSVCYNVSQVDPKTGDLFGSQCAHGADVMPAWEHYLLQKLAIETDELGFDEIAHR